jgi:hypothetical protein
MNVKSVDLVFRNAYNPNLVLGSNKKVSLMVFDILSMDQSDQEPYMQSHDLKLTFTCPDQWFLQYNLVETWIYNDIPVNLMNTTCDDLPALEEKQKKWNEEIKKENEENP